MRTWVVVLSVWGIGWVYVGIFEDRDASVTGAGIGLLVLSVWLARRHAGSQGPFVFPTLRNRANRIDAARIEAVAPYLQDGESVVANTSARMVPDPDDWGLGVIYVTNKRLVWYLPDAVEAGAGGIPFGVMDSAAYEDEILGVRLAGVSSTRVLLFQLYPGPISRALVEQLLSSAEAVRHTHGLNFTRSRDVLDL